MQAVDGDGHPAASAACRPAPRRPGASSWSVAGPGEPVGELRRRRRGGRGTGLGPCAGWSGRSGLLSSSTTRWPVAARWWAGGVSGPSASSQSSRKGPGRRRRRPPGAQPAVGQVGRTGIGPQQAGPLGPEERPHRDRLVGGPVGPARPSAAWPTAAPGRWGAGGRRPARGARGTIRRTSSGPPQVVPAFRRNRATSGRRRARPPGRRARPVVGPRRCRASGPCRGRTPPRRRLCRAARWRWPATRAGRRSVARWSWIGGEVVMDRGRAGERGRVGANLRPIARRAGRSRPGSGPTRQSRRAPLRPTGPHRVTRVEAHRLAGPSRSACRRQPAFSDRAVGSAASEDPGRLHGQRHLRRRVEALRRRHRGRRPRPRPSTTASSWCCSARRAAARPPRCG